MLLADDRILPVVASGNGRFQQPLRYHANEESDENTIIGDVRKDFQKRLGKMADSNINNAVANGNDNRDRPASFTFAFLKNSNQKFFKIDRTTGVVRTTSTRLDREAICSSNDTCTIETDVIIYRNSSPQSMVKLIFEVVDINDNHPIFPNTVLSETVSEGADRGELFSVRPATDKDSLKFGVVRYFLRDTFGGLFDVSFKERANHKEEPLVTINLKGSLDRESKDFYSLELLAADGGQPPKTGSMFVDISISDENDNAPVFQNLPYSLEIPENTVVSNFFSVQALDKDIDLNGKVEYRLSPESSYRFGQDFDINKITGSLKILRPLDYELYDVAILVIVANDLGIYRHSASASLTVSVIDTNDNAPEIDIIDNNKPTTIRSQGKESEGNVKLLNAEENSPPKTIVASFHVLDLDSGPGGAVDCSVSSENGDEQELFEMKKVTANDFNLVTTNNANLDRESKDRHFLSVTCKDSDVNQPMSSSMDLVIEVTDVNDNPPFVADCPKEFSLKEGNEPGFKLGEIVAYDVDLSDNGTIEYYIPKTTPTHQSFDIHPRDGVLRILEILDREHQDRYEFQIIARDKGHLQSTCTILVKVTDVEDCDPVFEQSKYFFKLHGEHFNPLHPIGQVRALDRDLPPANAITYNIVEEFEFIDSSKNDSSETEFEGRTNESMHERKSTYDADLGSTSESIFDIKSNSGLLYTAKPLRRSHVNRSHFVLLVMATSGIEQIGTATAEVHIDISQVKSRHRAISSSLIDEVEALAANNMSNDGNDGNGSEGKGQSDGGSHYLKIPLLLGFTCVLVGMTIFVAIIILQAICTKLSLARPTTNLIWTNLDKHQRTGQSGNPLNFNSSNKTLTQNGSSTNPRFHLSRVLNLTQHFVKPMFSRSRASASQDPSEQEKEDEKNSSITEGFRMSEEKQNALLDSLVTSSSTSSQSLLYSPRRASGYKPSSDSKEADSMDAYRTSTLPVSCRDRRSSGYYSPSRSTFSANVEEAGVLLKNGSRRSDDSSRKPSVDEDEDNPYQHDKPQTAENTLIFRLFDSQVPSTYHGRSKFQGKTTEENQKSNEHPVTPPSGKPIAGRFLWYHDV